jgi:hypothetical protein
MPASRPIGFHPEVVMRTVVVLGLLLACGARAAAFPAPVTYQPAKVGTKWVYQIEGTKKETVTSIVAAEKQGELLVVTIMCDNDAGGMATEVVSIGGDGIYRHAINNDPFDPHMCFLKLPIKVGDKWATDFTTRDTKVTGTRVVKGVEVVEVPAGKFQAVRVEDEYTVDKLKRKQTLWIAPNVGVVKHLHGDKSVSLLKSFEVPKK